MRIRSWLLALLSVITCTSAAFAYPQFIGFGYTSCTQCHYNPLGGGPVTDYGRAVSASAISARAPFLSDKITDEELAEYSGFLGKTTILPDWLRPHFKYRGLQLRSPLERTPVVRWIDMQFDGGLTLTDPDGKWVATATVGLLPTNTPRFKSQASASRMISREHYAGYRFKDGLGFYFGKMDHAFGLRVPDHISFSREKTLMAQNDQTYGLLAHTASGKWEGAVQGFFGNLAQDALLRQRGITLTTEYELIEHMRLGASFLNSSGSFRSRRMASVHTRIGSGEGSALLAEAGVIREAPIAAGAKLGRYVLLQGHYRIVRGFHWVMTGEHYTDDTLNSVARLYRLTTGPQWFPVQRLEFRLEVQGARTTGVPAFGADTFSLLSQVHVWL